MFSNFTTKYTKLCFINVLSIMLFPIAAIIDAAFLGNFDSRESVAGMQMASVILDFIYWSLIFLRLSINSLTAQAGNNKKAQSLILIRALIIGFILSFIILIFRNIIGDISFDVFFRGDENVEQLSRTYYDILIWGTPMVLCTYCQFGWLLGKQKIVQVLWFSLLLNVINIVLDYIFIAKMGYGVAGAAWALLIAQYTTVIACFVYINKDIKWTKKGVFTGFANYFKMNSELFIRNVILNVVFAAFTNISAEISTEVLAANTVLLRLMSLSYFFYDGIAATLETYAGRYYGRHKYEGIVRILHLTLQITFACTLVFLLLWEFGYNVAANFILPDADILGIVAGYHHYVAVMVVLFAIASIYDGLFIGLGHSKTMLLSVALPFILYAVLLRHHPWGAFIAFMVMRSAWLVYSFHYKARGE
jgi:MATE family multidrug resistance protein